MPRLQPCNTAHILFAPRYAVSAPLKSKKEKSAETEELFPTPRSHPESGLCMVSLNSCQYPRSVVVITLTMVYCYHDLFQYRLPTPLSRPSQQFVAMSNIFKTPVIVAVRLPLASFFTCRRLSHRPDVVVWLMAHRFVLPTLHHYARRPLYPLANRLGFITPCPVAWYIGNPNVITSDLRRWFLLDTGQLEGGIEWESRIKHMPSFDVAFWYVSFLLQGFDPSGIAVVDT